MTSDARGPKTARTRPRVTKFARRSLAALAVVAVIVALLVIFRKEETLEQAGRTGLECLRTRDAGCLWRYVHDSEERALNLDRAKFERILEHYVWPRLEGFVPDGEILFDSFGHKGSNLMVSMPFRNSQGKYLELGLWVSWSKGGPKFVGVVGSLMMSSFLSRSKDEDAGYNFSTYLRELRENRSELESLGLNGLFLSTGYQSWDALDKQWSKTVQAHDRAN